MVFKLLSDRAKGCHMNLGGPGVRENKMKPEDYEVQERPSLNSP